jgi:hypothetical protein
MSEKLSPNDAIRAMLDGETLEFNDNGDYKVWWDAGSASFKFGKRRDNSVSEMFIFDKLCRMPVKKTRLMTREEALAWAVSTNALGWVVKYDVCDWKPPQLGCYDGCISDYRRARITPDGTISDEQGFEVEVVE